MGSSLDDELMTRCLARATAPRPDWWRNRDLYEAADAADATACSRVRQLVRD
jgi:hypothetical protein